jgi:hypothetical protein
MVFDLRPPDPSLHSSVASEGFCSVTGYRILNTEVFNIRDDGMFLSGAMS